MRAADTKMDSRSSSLFRFDLYGRSVAKHFRDALHYFSCVVTQADDGVRAQLQRMLQAELEGVLPRFLTQISQDRDVAADQSLQTGANRPEN